MKKTDRSAVFLDRDGVINFDTRYVNSVRKFKLLPNVICALKKFQYLNFAIVIVTNQSGIAQGRFSYQTYKNIEKYFIDLISHHSIKIDGIYFCPHYLDENNSIHCNCRKPRPGMLFQAAKELSLNLTDSILCGDKYSDILAAYHAGVKSRYLIKHNQEFYSDYGEKVTGMFSSLNECADYLKTKQS